MSASSPPPIAATPEPVVASVPVVAGGLTEAQAVERALRNAPSVIRARASTAVATARRAEIAREFVPTVALTARYTRLSQAPTIALPDLSRTLHAAVEQHDFTCVDAPSTPGCAGAIVLTSPIVDQVAIRAGLSLPITDTLFRVVRLYEAAGLLSEARRIEEEVTIAQTALLARESFYGYIRSLARDAVATQGVALAERRSRDAEALVAAGRLAAVDSIRANASLIETRRDEAVAAAAARVAASLLRLRLGLPGDGPIGIGESFEGSRPSLASQAVLRTRALESVPEIRAINRRIQASAATANATRVAEYPGLVASANFDVSNPSPRIFPTTAVFYPSWDATIQLAWSPSVALSAAAAVDRMEAERRELVAQRGEIQRSVEELVLSSLGAADQARIELDAAAGVVAAAEASQQATFERWHSGRVSLLDVIVADNELLRARLAQLEAVVDERIALARLRRAIGDRDPTP